MDEGGIMKKLVGILVDGTTSLDIIQTAYRPDPSVITSELWRQGLSQVGFRVNDRRFSAP